MKYDLVIFDLDGTLLDTIYDLMDSVNEVLVKYNYPKIDLKKAYANIGYGATNFIKSSLKDESLYQDTMLEEFNICYKRLYKNKAKIYPNINKLLNYLKDNNIKIAINTNKDHQYALELAKDRFSNYNIDKVIGNGYGLPIKPDPSGVNEIIDYYKIEKSKVLFIGDSEADIKTANNAIVDSVFVSWGYRTYLEVKDTNPTYQVDDALEIIEIIKG